MKIHKRRDRDELVILEMQQIKGRWLGILGLILFSFSGCFDRFRTVQVVTYNVQNLFDDQYQGSEYSDFANLSSALYEQKVSNLAGGFERMRHHYGQLGIVLLQEVENNAVVSELVSRSRSLNGMHVIFAKEPSHATGLAILSRYEIIEARSVQVQDPLNNRAQLRPILIAVVRLANNQELIVINLHLQSQSREENIHRRTASLMQLHLTIEELRREYGHNVAMIIGGDFNMDLLDAPLLDAGIIDVGQQSQEVQRGGFYNAWPDIRLARQARAEPIGSYAFNGRWQALDGLLISHQLLLGRGLTFVRQEAVMLEYFLARSVDEASGEEVVVPKAFYQNRIEGVSDHLPVIGIFKFNRIREEV